MKLYRLENGRFVVTDNHWFIICIKETKQFAIKAAKKILFAELPNHIGSLIKSEFVEYL